MVFKKKPLSHAMQFPNTGQAAWERGCNHFDFSF
jgi:hypothetical protein